jgi:hypothetical protein
VNRYLLHAALLIQAALLLPRLALLPVWGDEQFTLSTIARSVPELFAAVRADVHPPLYYLINHYWLKFPLPGSDIVRVRFVSVVFCLLATIVIYRSWIRPLKPELRAWFLALWVLSPFLLLYARMGRSYSMQLLLASLALRYGFELNNTTAVLKYVLWATLLLYTHYLPGLAVPVAVLVYWIWKRAAFPKLIMAHGALALLYLPWVSALARAVRTAVGSGDYRLTSNELLEHGVRIAYTLLSTTFGETLPIWGFVTAVAVLPVLVLLLWQGVHSRPEWLAPIAIAAVISYAGAAAGVIFALTPARLLFLLPFYFLLLVCGRERLPRAGSIAFCTILVLSIAGIASYHRKENFLNKGYVIPFDEIAAAVERDLPRSGGFLIIDGSNTQPTPLLARLPEGVRHLTSYDARSLDDVRMILDNPGTDTIWFLRNTHDVTPELVNAQIESGLAARFRRRTQRSFIPYNALDRVAMKLLRWPSQPTHVLELLEFVRREPK